MPALTRQPRRWRCFRHNSQKLTTDLNWLRACLVANLPPLSKSPCTMRENGSEQPTLSSICTDVDGKFSLAYRLTNHDVFGIKLGVASGHYRLGISKVSYTFCPR